MSYYCCTEHTRAFRVNAVPWPRHADGNNDDDMMTTPLLLLYLSPAAMFYKTQVMLRTIMCCWRSV